MYLLLISFHISYRSILPVWEELLVFNENFNYLTQEDPQVVIFFEVGYYYKNDISSTWYFVVIKEIICYRTIKLFLQNKNNLKKMFPWFYKHSDACNSLNSSSTHYCVTRLQRILWCIKYLTLQHIYTVHVVRVNSSHLIFFHIIKLKVWVIFLHHSILTMAMMLQKLGDRSTVNLWCKIDH